MAERRLILMIIVIGLVVSVFQVIIWRISKKSRFMKYIPTLILFIIALICLTKAIWFSTGMEDLAYFIITMILGGAFIISFITGIVIDLLFKNSK
jgi:hypothetical protein